jgi:molybdate transport system substrate-binding protein
MRTTLHAGVAVAALAAALALGGCSGPDEDAIVLYAGAGLRNAVEAAITEFEKAHGIKVVVDWNGSGTILAHAKARNSGDLFMPGDVWYVDQLHEQAGLIAAKTSVAYFVPVILVRKDNTKNIRSLADFVRADVRVALGNPKACQVGRLSTKLLARNGVDRTALDPMESLTVNDLGVWVDTGKVDAAIVWDAIAVNYARSCRAIEIPKDKNIISHVVVGLMTTAKDPDKARKFIAFLTSPEGQAILNRHGLRTEAP